MSARRLDGSSRTYTNNACNPNHEGEKATSTEAKKNQTTCHTQTHTHTTGARGEGGRGWSGGEEEAKKEDKKKRRRREAGLSESKFKRHKRGLGQRPESCAKGWDAGEAGTPVKRTTTPPHAPQRRPSRSIVLSFRVRVCLCLCVCVCVRASRPRSSSRALFAGACETRRSEGIKNEV